MRYSARVITLIESLTSSKALTGKPSETSLEDVADTYAALKLLEKLAKARIEELGEVLMEAAEKGQPHGAKGALKANAGDAELIREKRTASLPDFEGLKGLVKEKGLAVTEAFDELKVLEVNPSKVQHLVDIGKLKAEEVEPLKKVSFSLKVTASDAAKQVLEEAVPAKAGK